MTDTKTEFAETLRAAAPVPYRRRTVTAPTVGSCSPARPVGDARPSAKTAQREVERLTQELAEAVAAAALLDGEEAGDPTPAQILDLNVEGDFGEGAVREYLTDLLTMVWTQREGFNGKRPWGNSGWEWELYQPMIDAGFLEADPAYDDARQLSGDERRKADRLIAEAIKSLAAEPTEEES